jgi:hypothetical protein
MYSRCGLARPKTMMRQQHGMAPGRTSEATYALGVEDDARPAALMSYE